MSGTLELTEALRAIEAWQNRHALVLGDLILDRYWWGTVQRISPEAPVPVVLKQRSSTALGGAANVARNIHSLGGAAFLVGVVGADATGREFRLALAEAGLAEHYVLDDASRPTTAKTRIVAHNQHVVRVDEETTAAVAPALRERLLAQVHTLLPRVDVLVISDYAKGLLTADLLREVLPVAERLGKPIVVDPKGLDYGRYQGATVLSPNRAEVLFAAGLPLAQADAVPSAATRLLTEARLRAILVTEGEAGMTLYEASQPPRHAPALARTVYDVTGAGDTVVATLSLALSCGTPLWPAAQLANVAAGLAVEQLGTTAVSAAQLREALHDHRYVVSPAP